MREGQAINKAWEDTAIMEILHNLYTEEEAQIFLHSKQELFEGEVPVEMIAAGRGREVLNVLQCIDDCVYM